MCLKTQVKTARFEVSDWLESFDNRAMEFFNGLVNVVQACMVLTTVDGKSVAPFLESAIFKLDAQTSQPLWVVLLLMVGCFQLVGLAIGTKRGTYVLRLFGSLASAFMSLAIVLALFNGPQPWILVVRYGIPVVAMTFTAGTLFAHHDAAMAIKETDASRRH
jgi:hypothetical protein